MNRILLFLFTTLLATHAIGIPPADQRAIEGVIHRYTTAWNKHGGKGFSGDWTEQADFINIFGMHFSGKQAIEERHITILNSFLKGTELGIADIQLRQERKDLVIAKVYWTLDHYTKPNPDAPNISRGVFLQTFVKEDDRWKIAATQNTLITD